MAVHFVAMLQHSTTNGHGLGILRPLVRCLIFSHFLERQTRLGGANRNLCNCLTHSRRHFIEAGANFPEECASIPETLGKVYHNDALARQRDMTPQQRLTFHQAESGPLMDQLKIWLAQQIDKKRCEPNSGLGSAITYMQKRWVELTRFLHVIGCTTG